MQDSADELYLPKPYILSRYTALEDAKPEACQLSRQTKAGKLANFRKDYCKDGKLVQDNLPLHWLLDWGFRVGSP